MFYVTDVQVNSLKLELKLRFLFYHYCLIMILIWLGLGGKTKTNFRPVLFHTYLNKESVFQLLSEYFFNTIMFCLVFFNSTDTYLYFHLNA